MGWYDDIEKVKVGSRGPKFVPGNYKVAIEALKEYSKDNDRFFIIEGLVLESDSAELKPGTVAGYAIKLNAKFPSQEQGALSEVKGAIAAILGMPAQSKEAMAINGQAITAVLESPSPLRGAIVNMQVWLKQPGVKSDPKTQPFAKANFLPVEPGKMVTYAAMPAWVAGPSVAAPTAAPSIASAVSAYVATPPPVVGPPPVVVPPPVPVTFPPQGWQAHPKAPGYWWKGTEALTEADLRARMAAGTA